MRALGLHQPCAFKLVLLSFFLTTCLHTDVDEVSPSRGTIRRVGGGGGRASASSSSGNGGGTWSPAQRIKHPSLYKRPSGGGGGGGDEEEEESECFPASGSITLRGGRQIEIWSSEVGNEVLLSTGEFSPIYTYSHRARHVTKTFVRIETTQGNLTVTPGHYVYTAGGRLQTASSVRPGDRLQTMVHGTDASVLHVGSVLDVGLYNPHTLAEELVVDGFRVSTYTTAVKYTTATSLLSPLRAIFRVSHIDLLSAFMD